MSGSPHGRWMTLTLIALGFSLATTLGGAPWAQAACTSPPLAATLKFQNAPPNATFSAGGPVNVVLQIQNVSGCNVVTTDGFSSSDFYRFLRLLGPKGGVINTNAASAAGLVTVHNVNKTFFCQSQNQGAVTLAQTIPVVPVQILDSKFFQEYQFDLAAFYDTTAPGLYQVTFQGEALVFSSVITCDQVAGSVADLRQSNSARTIFRSNALQFMITSATAGPLDHIVISPATSTIPAGGTEFYTAQGFDASNNSLGDVTASTTFTVAGGSCSGTACTASTPGDHTVTGKNSGKTATATLTVAPVSNLVKVWVGLANSDDVGIRFDLKAVLKKGGSQVGSGQLGSVSGGSNGFNNAILEKIPIFSASGPVSLSSGDSLEVLVRNSCSKSGKNSGTARLWYDGAKIDTGQNRSAGSRLDPATGTSSLYFLRSAFALRTTPGSAQTQTSVDALVAGKCGAYQSFGVWTVP